MSEHRLEIIEDKIDMLNNLIRKVIGIWTEGNPTFFPKILEDRETELSRTKEE